MPPASSSLPSVENRQVFLLEQPTTWANKNKKSPRYAFVLPGKQPAGMPTDRVAYTKKLRDLFLTIENREHEKANSAIRAVAAKKRVVIYVTGFTEDGKCNYEMNIAGSIVRETIDLTAYEHVMPFLESALAVQQISLQKFAYIRVENALLDALHALASILLSPISLIYKLLYGKEAREFAEGSLRLQVGKTEGGSHRDILAYFRESAKWLRSLGGSAVQQQDLRLHIMNTEQRIRIVNSGYNFSLPCRGDSPLDPQCYEIFFPTHRREENGFVPVANNEYQIIVPTKELAEEPNQRLLANNTWLKDCVLKQNDESITYDMGGRWVSIPKNHALLLSDAVMRIYALPTREELIGDMANRDEAYLHEERRDTRSVEQMVADLLQRGVENSQLMYDYIYKEDKKINPVINRLSDQIVGLNDNNRYLLLILSAGEGEHYTTGYLIISYKPIGVNNKGIYEAHYIEYPSVYTGLAPKPAVFTYTLTQTIATEEKRKDFLRALFRSQTKERPGDKKRASRPGPQVENQKIKTLFSLYAEKRQREEETPYAIKAVPSNDPFGHLYEILRVIEHQEDTTVLPLNAVRCSRMGAHIAAKEHQLPSLLLSHTQFTLSFLRFQLESYTENRHLLTSSNQLRVLNSMKWRLEQAYAACVEEFDVQTADILLSSIQEEVNKHLRKLGISQAQETHKALKNQTHTLNKATHCGGKLVSNIAPPPSAPVVEESDQYIISRAYTIPIQDWERIDKLEQTLKNLKDNIVARKAALQQLQTICSLAKEHAVKNRSVARNYIAKLVGIFPIPTGNPETSGVIWDHIGEEESSEWLQSLFDVAETYCSVVARDPLERLGILTPHESFNFHVALTNTIRYLYAKSVVQKGERLEAFLQHYKNTAVGRKKQQQMLALRQMLVNFMRDKLKNKIENRRQRERVIVQKDSRDGERLRQEYGGLIPTQEEWDKKTLQIIQKAYQDCIHIRFLTTLCPEDFYDPQALQEACKRSLALEQEFDRDRKTFLEYKKGKHHLPATFIGLCCQILEVPTDLLPFVYRSPSQWTHASLIKDLEKKENMLHLGSPITCLPADLPSRQERFSQCEHLVDWFTQQRLFTNYRNKVPKVSAFELAALQAGRIEEGKKVLELLDTPKDASTMNSLQQALEAIGISAMEELQIPISSGLIGCFREVTEAENGLAPYGLNICFILCMMQILLSNQRNILSNQRNIMSLEYITPRKNTALPGRLKNYQRYTNAASAFLSELRRTRSNFIDISSMENLFWLPVRDSDKDYKDAFLLSNKEDVPAGNRGFLCRLENSRHYVDLKRIEKAYFPHLQETILHQWLASWQNEHMIPDIVGTQEVAAKYISNICENNQKAPVLQAFAQEIRSCMPQNGTTRRGPHILSRRAVIEALEILFKNPLDITSPFIKDIVYFVLFQPNIIQELIVHNPGCVVGLFKRMKEVCNLLENLHPERDPPLPIHKIASLFVQECAYRIFLHVENLRSKMEETYGPSHNWLQQIQQALPTYNPIGFFNEALHTKEQTKFAIYVLTYFQLNVEGNSAVIFTPAEYTSILQAYYLYTDRTADIEGHTHAQLSVAQWMKNKGLLYLTTHIAALPEEERNSVLNTLAGQSMDSTWIQKETKNPYIYTHRSINGGGKIHEFNVITGSGRLVIRQDAAQAKLPAVVRNHEKYRAMFQQYNPIVKETRGSNEDTVIYSWVQDGISFEITYDRRAARSTEDNKDFFTVAQYREGNRYVHMSIHMKNTIMQILWKLWKNTGNVRVDRLIADNGVWYLDKKEKKTSTQTIIVSPHKRDISSEEVYTLTVQGKQIIDIQYYGASLCNIHSSNKLEHLPFIGDPNVTYLSKKGSNQVDIIIFRPPSFPSLKILERHADDVWYVKGQSDWYWVREDKDLRYTHLFGPNWYQFIMVMRNKRGDQEEIWLFPFDFSNSIAKGQYANLVRNLSDKLAGYDTLFSNDLLALFQMGAPIIEVIGKSMAHGNAREDSDTWLGSILNIVNRSPIKINIEEDEVNKGVNTLLSLAKKFNPQVAVLKQKGDNHIGSYTAYFYLAQYFFALQEYGTATTYLDRMSERGYADRGEYKEFQGVLLDFSWRLLVDCFKHLCESQENILEKSFESIKDDLINPLKFIQFLEKKSTAEIAFYIKLLCITARINEQAKAACDMELFSFELPLTGNKIPCDLFFSLVSRGCIEIYERRIASPTQLAEGMQLTSYGLWFNRADPYYAQLSTQPIQIGIDIEQVWNELVGTVLQRAGERVGGVDTLTGQLMSLFSGGLTTLTPLSPQKRVVIEKFIFNILCQAATHPEIDTNPEVACQDIADNLPVDELFEQLGIPDNIRGFLSHLRHIAREGIMRHMMNPLLGIRELATTTTFSRRAQVPEKAKLQFDIPPMDKIVTFTNYLAEHVDSKLYTITELHEKYGLYPKVQTVIANFWCYWLYILEENPSLEDIIHLLLPLTGPIAKLPKIDTMIASDLGKKMEEAQLASQNAKEMLNMATELLVMWWHCCKSPVFKECRDETSFITLRLLSTQLLKDNRISHPNLLQVYLDNESCLDDLKDPHNTSSLFMRFSRYAFAKAKQQMASFYAGRSQILPVGERPHDQSRMGAFRSLSTEAFRYLIDMVNKRYNRGIFQLQVGPNHSTQIAIDRELTVSNIQQIARQTQDEFAISINEEKFIYNKFIEKQMENTYCRLGIHVEYAPVDLTGKVLPAINWNSYFTSLDTAQVEIYREQRKQNICTYFPLQDGITVRHREAIQSVYDGVNNVLASEGPAYSLSIENIQTLKRAIITRMTEVKGYREQLQRRLWQQVGTFAVALHLNPMLIQKQRFLPENILQQLYLLYTSGRLSAIEDADQRLEFETEITLYLLASIDYEQCKNAERRVDELTKLYKTTIKKFSRDLKQQQRAANEDITWIRLSKEINSGLTASTNWLRYTENGKLYDQIFTRRELVYENYTGYLTRSLADQTLKDMIAIYLDNPRAIVPFNIAAMGTGKSTFILPILMQIMQSKKEYTLVIITTEILIQQLYEALDRVPYRFHFDIMYGIEEVYKEDLEKADLNERNRILTERLEPKTVLAYLKNKHRILQRTVEAHLPILTSPEDLSALRNKIVDIYAQLARAFYTPLSSHDNGVESITNDQRVLLETLSVLQDIRSLVTTHTFYAIDEESCLKINTECNFADKETQPIDETIITVAEAIFLKIYQTLPDLWNTLVNNSARTIDDVVGALKPVYKSIIEDSDWWYKHGWKIENWNSIDKDELLSYMLGELDTLPDKLPIWDVEKIANQQVEKKVISGFKQIVSAIKCATEVNPYLERGYSKDGYQASPYFNGQMIDNVFYGNPLELVVHTIMLYIGVSYTGKGMKRDLFESQYKLFASANVRISASSDTTWKGWKEKIQAEKQLYTTEYEAFCKSPNLAYERLLFCMYVIRNRIRIFTRQISNPYQEILPNTEEGNKVALMSGTGHPFGANLHPTTFDDWKRKPDLVLSATMLVLDLDKPITEISTDPMEFLVHVVKSGKYNAFIDMEFPLYNNDAELVVKELRKKLPKEDRQYIYMDKDGCKCIWNSGEGERPIPYELNLVHHDKAFVIYLPPHGRGVDFHVPLHREKEGVLLGGLNIKLYDLLQFLWRLRHLQSKGHRLGCIALEGTAIRKIRETLALGDEVPLTCGNLIQYALKNELEEEGILNIKAVEANVKKPLKLAADKLICRQVKEMPEKYTERADWYHSYMGPLHTTFFEVYKDLYYLYNKINWAAAYQPEHMVDPISYVKTLCEIQVQKINTMLDEAQKSFVHYLIYNTPAISEEGDHTVGLLSRYFKDVTQQDNINKSIFLERAESLAAYGRAFDTIENVLQEIENRSVWKLQKSVYRGLLVEALRLYVNSCVALKQAKKCVQEQLERLDTNGYERYIRANLPTEIKSTVGDFLPTNTHNQVKQQGQTQICTELVTFTITTVAQEINQTNLTRHFWNKDRNKTEPLRYVPFLEHLLQARTDPQFAAYSITQAGEYYETLRMQEPEAEGVLYGEIVPNGPGVDVWRKNHNVLNTQALLPTGYIGMKDVYISQQAWQIWNNYKRQMNPALILLIIPEESSDICSCVISTVAESEGRTLAENSLVDTFALHRALWARENRGAYNQSALEGYTTDPALTQRDLAICNSFNPVLLSFSASTSDLGYVVREVVKPGAEKIIQDREACIKQIVFAKLFIGCTQFTLPEIDFLSEYVDKLEYQDKELTKKQVSQLNQLMSTDIEKKYPILCLGWPLETKKFLGQICEKSLDTPWWREHVLRKANSGYDSYTDFEKDVLRVVWQEMSQQNREMHMHIWETYQYTSTKIIIGEIERKLRES